MVIAQPTDEAVVAVLAMDTFTVGATVELVIEAREPKLLDIEEGVASGIAGTARRRIDVYNDGGVSVIVGCRIIAGTAINDVGAALAEIW